ncbi:MAG: gluconokinase [Nostocaceae cyanobacterium]|nr:gluconokinase [Nostocaceae cyanobacterium]
MIILLMGVSGTGKTTIGQLLATVLEWKFEDGDDFHPPGNIDKMQGGIPLDDGDRIPWLLTLQKAIKEWLKEDKNVVLACSALKESYRQLLLVDAENIKLVYLQADFETIQKRLQERQNHFMPEKLLKSQFDALEEPNNAISVDVSQPKDVILQTIRESLGI